MRHDSSNITVCSTPLHPVADIDTALKYVKRKALSSRRTASTQKNIKVGEDAKDTGLTNVVEVRRLRPVVFNLFCTVTHYSNPL